MVKGAVLQPQAEVQRNEAPRPNSLSWHIEQFDNNPQAHGLDKNWYKFHGIGFLMNTQMHLLPEGAESNPQQLEMWAQQTKRDVLGFCLEYLSKGLVFSYKFKIDTKADGTKQLVDPLYGNRGAVEMIDEKERGGVVKRNMEKIEDFFLNSPDNALAVVPSPKGPSGLVTDDGKAINYETSFVFVMQKQGDAIVGSTIKTDLTNKEFRAMIKTLTGQTLPFDASLQDFVRAIALINPNERREGIKSPEDVIEVMRQAKLKYRDPDKNKGFAIDTAFENRKWDEIRDGVKRGEDLYRFNQETQQYVAEFMDYITQGSHDRTQLQKAVGATLLRVSRVFLDSQNAQSINSQLITTRDVPVAGGVAPARAVMPVPTRNVISFGQVYNEVKKIKGCAGGGTSGSDATSVTTMGGTRGGRINGGAEDESSWFNCPKCEQSAKPPVGDECPHCHYTKGDFVKEHPELAC